MTDIIKTYAPTSYTSFEFWQISYKCIKEQQKQFKKNKQNGEKCPFAKVVKYKFY